MTESRAPIYKSNQERKYKRVDLEKAYDDLRTKLWLAHKSPTDVNRQACTLASIARNHKIDRTCVWHYVKMRTADHV
jgi:hypothetical protein